MSTLLLMVNIVKCVFNKKKQNLSRKSKHLNILIIGGKIRKSTLKGKNEIHGVILNMAISRIM